MTPSAQILEKVINEVKTGFTKEVITNSFIPTNKNHFGISVINERGGFKFIIDYTFTIKKGKLVNSKAIKF